MPTIGIVEGTIDIFADNIVTPAEVTDLANLGASELTSSFASIVQVAVAVAIMGLISSVITRYAAGL